MLCPYPLQHTWLLKEQKEYIENRVQNQVHKTKSSFPSIYTKSTFLSQSFLIRRQKILLGLLDSKFCNTKLPSLMRWVHFCNVHFLWKCQHQNNVCGKRIYSKFPLQPVYKHGQWSFIWGFHKKKSYFKPLGNKWRHKKFVVTCQKTLRL